MANEKDRLAAEQDYNAGMKYQDLADKYGVSLSTVKSWKTRYGWSRKSTRTKTESTHTKKYAPKQTQFTPPADIETTALAEPLNDRQQLFCEIYAQT